MVEKINGVLSSQFECALYQVIFTWIILDYANIEFKFIYCAAAAFFRCVPFVSTQLIGLLASIQYYFTSKQDNSLALAIVLAVVYFYVDGHLSVDIYEKKL